MIKLRYLVGSCAVLALTLAVTAPIAAADPFAGPPICSSAGKALSGNQGNLTITGNAYVPRGATLNVQGTLRLEPGACLDAFTLSTVHVGGSVLVGHGAILALGCSPGAIGPQRPCESHTTSDTVGGNIIAEKPLTMYLTADTVRGSVISTGGGPGLTLNPYINFPIKENKIGGDLVISNWQGAWFGILRNTVQGSVYALENVGLATDEFGHPDSTEIVTNTISGNLVCYGNNPAAQLGDSGGVPNTVAGQKLGQCTAV